jgi:ubiquinone/menaquinone biosynthesis C-methylase UbiE
MNPAEFNNIARLENSFWWFRGMEEILFRALDPIFESRRLLRIMEAGCGTGHMAMLLEQRYGARVFPTDLQPQGLAYGTRKGLIRSAQADVALLPFSAGRFDAVFSLDVLVHLPRGQEDQALRELARVTAPGGVLILRVSALDFLRSRHSEFTTERQRFTRGRLMRLASRHGLHVLRCTYANSLLLPVALAKFRIVEPLLRKRPQSGVQPVPGWLNDLLHSVLHLEASWIGAGWNFPLGQSLLLVAEKPA